MSTTTAPKSIAQQNSPIFSAHSDSSHFNFSKMNLSVLYYCVLSTFVTSTNAFALSTQVTQMQTLSHVWSSGVHLASKRGDNEEEDEIVTREMLLRDMLSDSNSVNITDGNEVSSSATVRRKKKNKSRYRTLDNRDSLPFLVKVNTPDPYTNNMKMKKDAKLNSKRHKKAKGKSGGKKRQNLVGTDEKDAIASSILKRDKEGNMHRIVGEFSLDKSTNCGDIIEIGDGTEYQVQKARCQYKYAGGKRFVMVRKILEVKEIKRILVEKEVQQLFEKELDENTMTFDNDDLMLE